MNEIVIPTARAVTAGKGGAWIGAGWQYFKASPLAWVLAVLIYMLISGISNFIPFIGGLAFTVINPILVAGLMLGCAEQDLGKPFNTNYLFSAFKKNPAALALSGTLMLVASLVIMLLVSLVTGVSLTEVSEQQLISQQAAISYLLALLLFMALYIPVIMAFYFAPVLIVRHNLKVMDACKLSVSGCMKNMLPFLIYGVLILLLLLIVTPFTLGLGLFVIMPVLMASLYAAYKDIFLDEVYQA